MNLGGPTAPGLADGLRSVFFNAPVPSGCTLTMVLSIETTSSLMRTICSRCRYSNTLSSTPFFDHRFIRVYTVCQLPNRLGNPPPLAPLLGDIQHGVQHLQVGQPHVATLNREDWSYAFVLSFCNFHTCIVSNSGCFV